MQTFEKTAALPQTYSVRDDGTDLAATSLGIQWRTAKDFAGRALNEKARERKEITKEVVGIHVLLTRSVFGGGILHRFLQRVSLVKSTSAAVRF
jgi:hypothetical protein